MDLCLCEVTHGRREISGTDFHGKVFFELELVFDIVSVDGPLVCLNCLLLSVSEDLPFAIRVPALLVFRCERFLGLDVHQYLSGT